MLITYGIGTGTEADRRVGRFLGIRAIEDSRISSIRHYFDYDQDTEAAYICEQSVKLLRVTKNGIERVTNGAGGHLFEFNKEYREYTVGLESLDLFTGGISRALVPSDMLAKVFDGVQLEENRLTAEHKKILVSTWIIVMMLSGLIVEKAGRI